MATENSDKKPKDTRKPDVQVKTVPRVTRDMVNGRQPYITR